MYKILISLLVLLILLESIHGSPCPKYWTDATHVGLGCLFFNTTTKMTWPEAQISCASENNHGHLVEIFNQEQKNFLVYKAFEIEALTGMGRYWWIGLTDETFEGRWIWPYSLKEAEFFAWNTGQPSCGTNCNYVALYYGHDYKWDDIISNGSNLYPLCQIAVE